MYQSNNIVVRGGIGFQSTDGLLIFARMKAMQKPQMKKRKRNPHMQNAHMKAMQKPRSSNKAKETIPANARFKRKRVGQFSCNHKASSTVGVRERGNLEIAISRRARRKARERLLP
eukprot:1413794-Rhodomonas_salina.3